MADDESAPPGYIPLLITGPTQAIIECIIDEHVTDEAPYKLIPKQVFLDDVQKRAAVSDFSPVKKEIANAELDDILVVYDADFLYGQNFFLIITNDAKLKYLYPNGPPADPDALPTPGGQEGGAEGEEDLNEIFIYKPPSPRPWMSLGSEDDVKDMQVKNKRDNIKLICNRKRKFFNTEVKFSYSEVKIESIKPKKNATTMTTKMQQETPSQAVVITKENVAQTKRPDSHRNQWVQTQPREKTVEQQKEVLASEEIKSQMTKMEPLVNLCLQQNDLYNPFDDCWEILGSKDDGFGSKSDGHLREYQSFTDLVFSKDKRLTCIDWHPKIKGIIAVSCAQRVSLYDRIDLAPKLLLSPSVILIWSFSDPIHPCLLLQAPTDVYSFQFCPSNPDIISAGCINGQIVLWDIAEYHEKLVSSNEKSQPKKKQSLFGEEQGPDTPIVMWKAVSAIENGHKAPISQIQWIPAGLEMNKLGQTIANTESRCVQLLTTAADGSFAVWDMRPPPQKASMTGLKKRGQKEQEQKETDPYAHLNLFWKPLLKANLQNGDSGVHNPTKISLPKFNGETIKNDFFCGTEQGDVLYTSSKLVKDGDSGKLVAPRPNWQSDAHAGPITTVARSPFFPEVVLTVGGWSFSIWKETENSDVSSTPLLHVSSNDKKYTAGAWSPTRPSIIFLGTHEGNVEVWDLLEKTHEASVIQNISTARITQLTPWVVSSKTNLIAVSDSVGTLHILEIPWNYRYPTPNETQTVHGYIAREVSRIEYFLDRKNQDQLSETVKVVTEQDLNEILTEDDLQNDYKEYMKLEEQLLVKLSVD